MIEFNYDRRAAVEYALKWALSRNPNYYDFSEIGGDCTNFASQCLYAGSGIMNYTPTFGWFYISVNDRAPAWTGVEQLYNFLVNNKSVAVFGEQVDRANVQIGDLIQLGRATGDFYHTPVITDITDDEIYVCAHSVDSINRPLSSYEFDTLRYVHIIGVRKYD